MSGPGAAMAKPLASGDQCQICWAQSTIDSSMAANETAKNWLAAKPVAKPGTRGSRVGTTGVVERPEHADPASAKIPAAWDWQGTWYSIGT
jgi:hypothetical protein